MKNDAQLKKDVLAELEWDPAINAAGVGVAVKDSVITLSGHLDNYVQKYAIERAVQRVEGVKAVAIELDVKLSPEHKRSDTEIAQAAEQAFEWHSLIPSERIRVKVEKGWITLTGEMDWAFQRTNAENAVRPLTGVIGVTNSITLKPQAAPVNIAARIRDALTRHAETEAKNIDVAVNGAVVTLRGKVHSWSERAAVQGAVWSAPGISQVVNELQVTA